MTHLGNNLVLLRDKDQGTDWTLTPGKFIKEMLLSKDDLGTRTGHSYSVASWVDFALSFSQVV